MYLHALGKNLNESGKGMVSDRGRRWTFGRRMEEVSGDLYFEATVASCDDKAVFLRGRSTLACSKLHP